MNPLDLAATGFSGAGAIMVAGSVLRLVAAVFAFAMLLKTMSGVFLTLTHCGSEERKAVAGKAVRNGGLGFVAMAVVATVIPPAAEKLSEIASRYL